MDFVNAIAKDSKNATFKQLFMFAGFGILKVSFFLLAFGGFFWIIRHL